MSGKSLCLFFKERNFIFFVGELFNFFYFGELINKKDPQKYQKIIVTYTFKEVNEY